MRRNARTTMLNALTIVAAACGFAAQADAAILFEGYSKVLLAGAHVGFVIERYEFDEKKKEFSTAYLLKTATPSGSLMESLRARSSATLAPLSYNYTSLVGANASSIDATFKGEEMTLKIRQGNSVKTSKKKIKKGVFLSRFLVYLMLQSKEGIQTGAKYSFQAIAEEDGEVYAGEAFVKGREDVAGEAAFKLLSKFKGSQSVGLVTSKGEVLGTRQPSDSIASELVADPKDAMAGQAISQQTLKMVFGNTPEGKENVIARKAAGKGRGAGVDPGADALPTDPAKRKRLEPAEPDPAAPPVKGAGVPPGQGIETKPAAPSEKPAGE